MSQLPKRTTFGSSCKNPQRKSRIAQPIKRSSIKPPEYRSRSVDNSIVEPPLNAPSSTVKLPRSSSLTRVNVISNRISGATPLRTPLRLNQFNPTSTYSTAEKFHNDKKWIVTQSTYINEFLPNIPGIGVEIAHNGGIRSITTKQFATLMTVLLQAACGKKIQPKGNIIDRIAELLPQIDYPYTINKSSLKTINANHSFPHLVVLVRWLLDFVNTSGSIEFVEHSDNIVIIDDEFPNREYAEHFIEQTKKGFMLWNLQQDKEFEDLNNALVDNYIMHKTGISGLAELEEAIGRVKEEIEQLLKNRVVVKDMRDFEIMELHVHQLKSKIAEFKNAASKSLKSIKKLKSKIKSSTTRLRELTGIVEEQKASIANQLLTVKERDALLDKIQISEMLLDAQIKTQQEIENMGHENQIKYSRLIQKCIDQATQVNNILYKFSMDRIIPNIDDLKIDCSNVKNIDAKIPIISQFLATFKSDMLQRQKTTSKALQELNYANIELTQINKRLDANNAQLRSRYAELLKEQQRKFSEATEIVNAKEAERDTELAKISSMQKEVQTLSMAVNKTVQQIEQQNFSNVEFKEQTEKFANDVLEAKTRRLREMKDLVDSFDAFINDCELDFE